jgi:hypothetical protein
MTGGKEPLTPRFAVPPLPGGEGKVNSKSAQETPYAHDKQYATDRERQQLVV